jgi:hypothetical protein
MMDTGKVIHNSIKTEQDPPAAPANLGRLRDRAFALRRGM